MLGPLGYLTSWDTGHHVEYFGGAGTKQTATLRNYAMLRKHHEQSGKNCYNNSIVVALALIS